MVELRRRQTDVVLKELASPGSRFDPVRHRLAQLPHSEVEELSDGEGTDNHLGGNAVPAVAEHLVRVTADEKSKGGRAEPK